MAKNKVEVEFKDIQRIHAVMTDDYKVIQAKYPSADHLERKGMKLMMDELSEGGEICLKIIRKQNVVD